MLLITGRHYPFDITKEDDQASASAKPLVLTLRSSTFGSPPSSISLARKAIDVALETIGLWKENWQWHPALLSAVLRFFDFTWQHLIDFGTALDDFRTNPAPWDAMVKIAFEDVGDASEVETEVVDYCHRMMAKVHAVRILALDIQGSTSRPIPKALEGRVSAKALFKALSIEGQLAKAMSGATYSSCAPELHEEVSELLQERMKDFQLDSLRRPVQFHPLDHTRNFGNDYLYSLPLLQSSLHHLRSDSSMIDGDDLANIIAKASQLNLNFSLLDSQISNSRSWRQLLEISLPLLRRDASASATVLVVAAGVASDIAHESRTGQIMVTVHSERLSILLTMVEVIQNIEANTAKDQVVILLKYLAAIFDSITLPPLESVVGQKKPPFHRTLFRIAFFVYRKLNTFGSISLFTTEQQHDLSSSTKTILRAIMDSTRELYGLARSMKDYGLAEDLTLAVAVLSQIIQSISVPAPATWLSYSSDLFRTAFEVFVRMDVVDDNPARPLYAQSVLDLCLMMTSASEMAAEQIALSGVMTALTNNALTTHAEAGTITVHPATLSAGRTAQHEIWTSMLALVVALVKALGQSTQFMEEEITGFLRLYERQINIGGAMNWTMENELTLSAIEEMKNLSALMYGIIMSSSDRRSGLSGVGGKRGGSHDAVTTVFIERSLHLLQQVVYAILHPHHLASLLEPTSIEEKNWLDSDLTSAALADTGGDWEKRPVIGSVIYELLTVARNVIDGLVIYSTSFETLTKDLEEWKTDRAILVPVRLNFMVTRPLILTALSVTDCHCYLQRASIDWHYVRPVIILHR
jgi:nuclear pore complex protein Nup188